MPVIADIDANPAIGGIEYRPIGSTRLEEELFPETSDMRKVRLAVLAEIPSICINDCRRVVVDARHRLLIDRHNDHHIVLLGIFFHQRDRMPVWDRFRSGIPLGILTWAEIGLRKYFLKTQHLHAFSTSLVDQGQVRLKHGITNFFRRILRRTFKAHLDQA